MSKRYSRLQNAECRWEMAANATISHTKIRSAIFIGPTAGVLLLSLMALLSRYPLLVLLTPVPISLSTSLSLAGRRTSWSGYMHKSLECSGCFLS